MSVEWDVALGQCYTVPLNLLEISVPDSSREGGGSTKKAMKDAIFSLEGRSALGEAQFRSLERAVRVQWFPTQWLGMTKGPGVNVPGRDSGALWEAITENLELYALHWESAQDCSPQGQFFKERASRETLETQRERELGSPPLQTYILQVRTCRGVRKGPFSESPEHQLGSPT